MEKTKISSREIIFELSVEGWVGISQVGKSHPNKGIKIIRSRFHYVCDTKTQLGLGFTMCVTGLTKQIFISLSHRDIQSWYSNSVIISESVFFYLVYLPSSMCGFLLMVQDGCCSPSHHIHITAAEGERSEKGELLHMTL